MRFALAFCMLLVAVSAPSADSGQTRQLVREKVVELDCSWATAVALLIRDGVLDAAEGIFIAHNPDPETYAWTTSEGDRSEIVYSTGLVDNVETIELEVDHVGRAAVLTNVNDYYGGYRYSKFEAGDWWIERRVEYGKPSIKLDATANHEAALEELRGRLAHSQETVTTADGLVCRENHDACVSEIIATLPPEIAAVVKFVHEPYVRDAVEMASFFDDVIGAP